jgi:hypothetical protein
MDFVMHNAHAERPGMPPIAGNQNMSQSPCPAVRAAAASEQYPFAGPHSPPRPIRHSHYDPVHSNSIGGASWWTPQNPYHTWQQLPFPSYPYRSLPYAGGMPPFSTPLDLRTPHMDTATHHFASTTVGSESHHSHAHGAYSPPESHHYRSNDPTLPRLGDTRLGDITPGTPHRLQGSFGSTFQDSPRPLGNVLPALNPLAASPSRHSPHQ